MCRDISIVSQRLGITALKLKVTKNSTGHYVFPQFIPQSMSDKLLNDAQTLVTIIHVNDAYRKSEGRTVQDAIFIGRKKPSDPLVGNKIQVSFLWKLCSIEDNFEFLLWWIWERIHNHRYRTKKKPSFPLVGIKIQDSFLWKTLLYCMKTLKMSIMVNTYGKESRFYYLGN